MNFCLLLGILLGLQDEKPFRSFEERLESATEVHAEVQAEVWFASFAGSGRLNKWFGMKRDHEKDAPRMSFDREGRLGATEPAPGFEVQVLWENEKQQYRGFRVQYEYGAWSESGTIDQSFVVDGTTVPAGSPFRSRFRRDSASVDLVGGIRLSEVPLDIWGWGGCHYHLGSFKMQTSSGDLEDGAGGLNFEVGGHVEVRPLPFLFAGGELSAAIGFGVPDFQARISAGLIWNSFRLEGGYRHVWAWWDVDPAFRLSMGGPFVGVSARF
jgi:hypothetical protein